MDNFSVQTDISRRHLIENAQNSFINDVYKSPDSKEQLKKVASEFESLFVSKMVETLDKTVDKDSGIFGKEGSYLKNFKSYMFMQLGRDIAKNPVTSFGFAKQIYEQMERYLPKT